jgi:hypothetical protein
MDSARPKTPRRDAPNGDMDDHLGVYQDLRLRPELAPYRAAVVPAALAAANALALLACFWFNTPQVDCRGVGLCGIVCCVVESQAGTRVNSMEELSGRAMAYPSYP